MKDLTLFFLASNTLTATPAPPAGCCSRSSLCSSCSCGSRWMTARSTKALKAGRQICLVVCFGGARRDLTQEDWLITALSRCGREVERERESPKTTALPAEGRERPREPEDEMSGGRSWRRAPHRPVVVAAVLNRGSWRRRRPTARPP